MEGLLSAKIEERITGTAEIRETFKISKVGTIAGCFVTDGTTTGTTASSHPGGHRGLHR